MWPLRRRHQPHFGSLAVNLPGSIGGSSANRTAVCRAPLRPSTASLKSPPTAPRHARKGGKSGYGLPGQLDVVESSIMVSVICLHRKDQLFRSRRLRKALDGVRTGVTVRMYTSQPKKPEPEVVKEKQVTMPRGVAQSWLARLNGVQKVGGSNPLAPTFLGKEALRRERRRALPIVGQRVTSSRRQFKQTISRICRLAQ